MKKSYILKKIAVFLLLTMGMFLGGCAINGKTNKEGKDSSSKAENQSKVKSEKGAKDKNPVVTIEMEDGSKIKVELYPEIAPNTVRNFLSLAQKGFYDGLIFHRVIPNFMIQGGDPKGTGTGGPDYTIKGEFKENNFENALKHERGVISMARGKDLNSAGSQFFIMVKATPSLDGKYAAFGKVIEGMEVVDKIVSTKTNTSDKPLMDQRMKKVTVDTFGVKYNEVEKVK